MHHAYQVIFFYKVFTQTLMIHKTVGEGRAQFLFLYPTSNRSQKFKTFFCYFACEMATSIFSIYHTATRSDLPSCYCINTWVNDDGMLIFLLAWWFDSRFSIKAIWHRKRWIWTYIALLSAKNNDEYLCSQKQALYML